MSKPPNSGSHSQSKSRSRSRSYTRSHSRSRSRSRSRKRRYSSRSRSRSPSRERNYPSRDFQGNRGYNRGFRGYRRPFQYHRGRGRGYFPRGNYHHRGGGPYGYRSNNWHGHRDQQQPYDHSHSPRRGRSRSHSPRKRSASRSRSRHSDRSSSGRSRRSSSSSRSSSPRRRNSSSKRPQSKDGKGRGSPGEDKTAAKESSKPRGSPPEEGSSKWEGLTDYDASPKRSGNTASTGGPSEIKVSLSGGSGNGGPLWRSVGPATKSSPPKTSASSGFGFFSKEDIKGGDKSASISTAFKKFLAEKKKPLPDRDNGRGEALSPSDADNEKMVGKSRSFFNASDSGYDGSKTDKGLPFLDAEEEKYHQEMKDRKNEEESKYKDKLPPNVRNLAEERFGKWDEDVEEELDEELYRNRKQARKEEKAAKKKEKKKSKISPSALSPSRVLENKNRPLFPAGREVSPLTKSSTKKDPQFNFSIKAFADEGESSSGALAKERRLSRELSSQGKKDHEEFRSIFQHVQSAQLRRSPSELFAHHIVTIVHHIKAQHFQSAGLTMNERFGIYQRKAAEMETMKAKKSPEIHRRIDVSPSAFKKHSQLFEDFEESGYKDHGKKHDADSLDLRLAIERRKKDPKRDGGKSSAGSRTPSNELSPERSSKHKKSKKSKKKRERSPSSSSSSSSSPSPSPRRYRVREYHMDDQMEGGGGFNKARLGHREFPGHMERGPRDYEGHMDRGYERGRGGYDRGGYDRGRGGYDRGFPRIRGRGWNRGNYPGNNINNNPQNMPGPSRPPDEEWDPEYTPKSRKYFQHDDRDKEAEMKWLDTRGRGRGSFPRTRGTFMVRKGGSPKWTHDMFPGATEEGEIADSSADHSLKDDDKSGDSPSSKP